MTNVQITSPRQMAGSSDGTREPARLQSAPILQRRIPFDLTDASLPGTRPLSADDWTFTDTCFAAQMALRADLLEHKRADVLALDPSARPAANELLDYTLDLFHRLPDRGYHLDADAVLRPDGVTIAIDRDDPLGTLGRLVQQDLCILQKQGAEHVLTGAVLCFPANWRLDEKFGHPLSSIHAPVPSYDTDITRRVQRLFDGVRVGRPIWRFNRLWYANADLHQPRSVQDPRHQEPDKNNLRFFRSEKQAIFRLPRTGAVIFAIHTFILAESDVPPGIDLS